MNDLKQMFSLYVKLIEQIGHIMIDQNIIAQDPSAQVMGALLYLQKNMEAQAHTAQGLKLSLESILENADTKKVQ